MFIKTKQFSLCSVLRPTTIPGVSTIHYRIRIGIQSKLISSRLRISNSQWDGERPMIASLRDKFENDIFRLKTILTSDTVKSIDLNEIADEFRTDTVSTPLLDFMTSRISGLQAEGRYGTARNYRSTMLSIKEYSKCSVPMLDDIDSRWLAKYRTWLIKRKASDNTINFYMRVLKSVIRRAQKMELIPETNPFRDIATTSCPTQKRAVTADVIRRLQGLDLSENKKLQLARDIFMFSLMTRGMSFVDIAFLTKDNIRDNSIIYKRRKTGKLLIIKLEKPILDIIRRYADPERKYLFPLITKVEIEGADDKEKEYAGYRRALDAFNRRLHKLGRIIGLTGRLTSYVARHTWATLLYRSHVPVSLISAGLGHHSERTTLIYLAAIENREIDNINYKLLLDLFKT